MIPSVQGGKSESLSSESLRRLPLDWCFGRRECLGKCFEWPVPLKSRAEKQIV